MAKVSKYLEVGKNMEPSMKTDPESRMYQLVDSSPVLQNNNDNNNNTHNHKNIKTNHGNIIANLFRFYTLKTDKDTARNSNLLSIKVNQSCPKINLFKIV